MSFSDISLLVYRNATDFYMLILYSETILNLFLRFDNKDFLYKIMSLAKRDNFTSSFSIF